MTMPALVGLSFSDCPVSAWQFDPAARLLRVVVADGHYTGVGFAGRPVTLAVGPWVSFAGRRFPLKQPVAPVADPSEPLTEVCEWGLGPAGCWLAGFGAASGDWLRYEFGGPVAADWCPVAEPGAVADGRA